MYRLLPRTIHTKHSLDTPKNCLLTGKQPTKPREQPFPKWHVEGLRQASSPRHSHRPAISFHPLTFARLVQPTSLPSQAALHEPVGQGRVALNFSGFRRSTSGLLITIWRHLANRARQQRATRWYSRRCQLRYLEIRLHTGLNRWNRPLKDKDVNTRHGSPCLTCLAREQVLLT